MLRRIAAGLTLVVATVACGGTKLTHVPAPGTHTETFEQNAASKIDLLWVVDNSGSMADKQAKLAASFQRFIDLFARGAIDYRVAVTTTDVFADAPGSSGTFYGAPAIIQPTDDDPLAEFQTNIKVGTSGSGNEEGLAAAKMALDLVSQQNQPILQARQACIAACGAQSSNSKSCVTSCQQNNEPSFLRPEAYLYVVFVSDDEDHSPEEALYYGRYLETVKGLGNEAAVSASAIVGDPSGPTCDARAGIKYAGVATYTGGIFGSICDATFDQNLTRLATDAVGLQRHFLLGAYPQLSSLQLQLAYRCDTDPSQLAMCQSVSDQCGSQPDQLGLICTPRPSQVVPVDDAHPEGYTAGWSYQCSDNSISFHKDATGDAVPGLRSELQVTFLVSKDAQCAP